MIIAFFSSLFFLLYTFIGYPLLLQMVRKEQLAPSLQSNLLPDLTVVICIYNSANLLSQRIENILSSDYPKEKLNILIISDGSTDNPEKVINAISNPMIELFSYSQNKGKSYALAYAKTKITTPFVAFTDIRQSFDKIALKVLASSLITENIGAVSGNLKIISSQGNEEAGLYWRYEKAIRKKESDLKSLLGVTGAIYMAKTELLPNVPEDSLLDDMYIPLSIVKQGYLVKFCEQAVAYDSESNSLEEEFARKVRTLAGNYQLMRQLPWLLSIRQNPLFIQFVSHKVARLVMPFSLIVLLVSSFFLPLPERAWLIALQLSFYGYALFGYIAPQLSTKLPLISTCISFCSLNLAALVAAWKYFTTKDITSLWKKH